MTEGFDRRKRDSSYKISNEAVVGIEISFEEKRSNKEFHMDPLQSSFFRL